MLQTVCINGSTIGIRRHPRHLGRLRSLANRLLEANMRTATVTLRGAEFTQKMTEMRMWLDEHFFEPIRFLTSKTEKLSLCLSISRKIIMRKPFRAALPVGRVKWPRF